MLTEQQVLHYISRQPKHMAGFKQLVHDLAVKGRDRRELQQLLRRFHHSGGGYASHAAVVDGALAEEAGGALGVLAENGLQTSILAPARAGTDQSPLDLRLPNRLNTAPHGKPSPLRGHTSRAMENRPAACGRDPAKSGHSSAWSERTVRDREVGGSNPLAPTN